MLKRIKRYLRNRRLERAIRRHLCTHGFICHCQYCNHPLFDTPRRYNGTLGDEVLLCYEYRCSSCEMFSMFTFDLAPVPLLLDQDGPFNGHG